MGSYVCTIFSGFTGRTGGYEAEETLFAWCNTGEERIGR
jgi:hypothetical protein